MTSQPQPSLAMRHMVRSEARQAGYAAGVEYSYVGSVLLWPEDRRGVAAPGSYLPLLALTVAIDPGIMLSDPQSPRGELCSLQDYVETTVRACVRQISGTSGQRTRATVRVDVAPDFLGGPGWDELPLPIEREAGDLRALLASWVAEGRAEVQDPQT